MPSATGSAPPERPVPAPRATNGTPLAGADPDDRLHLGGRAGEDDELRHGAPARQPVAVVDAQLLRLRDHVVGADDGPSSAATAGESGILASLLRAAISDCIDDRLSPVRGAQRATVA